MKLTGVNIKQIAIVLFFSIGISLLLPSSIKILQDDVLLTYISVLIGFAITIYTFGLTFFASIAEQLSKSKNIKEEDKEPTFNNLVSGYEHLKENVWIITYCLMGVILAIFLYTVRCNYYKEIAQFNLLKIAFDLNVLLRTFFFLLATRAYLDLIKSLLTISSIIIETTKQNGLNK